MLLALASFLLPSLRELRPSPIFLPDSACFQELNQISAMILQVSLPFPWVFAQREELRGNSGEESGLSRKVH